MRGRSTGPAGRSTESISGAEDRREVRSAVARFLTAGFVAAVLVATPVIFWIRAEAQEHALVNARDLTQRLADNVVAPLITAELLAQDAAALERLDRRLAPWLENGTLTRIKVWDEQGRVVYSDAESLIGQDFGHQEWARVLLAGGPGTAMLEDQTGEENEFEAEAGELVEVYVRSESSTGAPMVFETYSPGTAVRSEQNTVVVGMIPPVVLSLAVLQLAQLVPAVRLARRIQVHQATRTALLRHAIEASDQERRRMAGELHDEVIQDLSGLAYAVESEVRRGSPELGSVFHDVHVILRNCIGKLRAMTSELYPSDLEELGLRTSLQRLATPLTERGVAFLLEVPETLDLDRDTAVLVHRVARESLINATRHASPTTVGISVRQVGRQVRITVSDDGVGFDPEAARHEGHFGLRILADTMRHAGGSFDLRSRPGEGTTVTAVIDVPAPSSTGRGGGPARHASAPGPPPDPPGATATRPCRSSIRLFLDPVRLARRPPVPRPLSWGTPGVLPRSTGRHRVRRRIRSRWAHRERSGTLPLREGAGPVRRAGLVPATGW